MNNKKIAEIAELIYQDLLDLDQTEEYFCEITREYRKSYRIGGNAILFHLPEDGEALYYWIYYPPKLYRMLKTVPPGWKQVGFFYSKFTVKDLTQAIHQCLNYTK